MTWHIENDELLESLELDEEFPPLISNDEDEETPAKEEEDVKEEEEPPWHENTSGDSKDNLIEVNSEDQMVNPARKRGMGFGMIT